MRVLLPTLALVATLSACLGSGYRIAGPDRQPAVVPLQRAGDEAAAQRARARPRLVLRVDQPELLARRVWSGRVVLQILSRPPNERRLLLQLERGPRVTIDYALPVGQRFPLRPGEEVTVRYLLPDQEARFQGAGLVLRRPDGSLVAALAAGGGLPADVFGDALELSPSHRDVYTEVRQLPSLCLVVLVHRYLRARLPGRPEPLLLAPGTVASLRLGAAAYKLVVADVAEPEGERCRAEAPAHLSYVVLADDRPAARRRPHDSR